MRFGWAGVAQSLFSHSETFSLSSKLILIFLIPLCRLVYIFSYFFTSSLLHTIEEYKRKSMKKKGMKNWFRLCRRLSSVRERSLLVKDIFSVFFSINSFSSMLFFLFSSLVCCFFAAPQLDDDDFFFVSSPPLLSNICGDDDDDDDVKKSRLKNISDSPAMIMTMMMAIEFELMWKFLHSQHYWLTGFALFFFFFLQLAAFLPSFFIILRYTLTHSILCVYIFFLFLSTHERQASLYTKK